MTEININIVKKWFEKYLQNGININDKIDFNNLILLLDKEKIEGKNDLDTILKAIQYFGHKGYITILQYISIKTWYRDLQKELGNKIVLCTNTNDIINERYLSLLENNFPYIIESRYELNIDKPYFEITICKTDEKEYLFKFGPEDNDLDNPNEFKRTIEQYIEKYIEKKIQENKTNDLINEKKSNIINTGKGLYRTLEGLGDPNTNIKRYCPGIKYNEYKEGNTSNLTQQHFYNYNGYTNSMVYKPSMRNRYSEFKKKDKYKSKPRYNYKKQKDLIDENKSLDSFDDKKEHHYFGNILESKIDNELKETTYISLTDNNEMNKEDPINEDIDNINLEEIESLITSRRGESPSEMIDKEKSSKDNLETTNEFCFLN